LPFRVLVRMGSAFDLEIQRKSGIDRSAAVMDT
jgi:hypothetical protein